ncbi:hypothetical protein [Bradyrhizobium sp. CB3481]|uniref:hypothetical protein n=1 Tax=Bradyrhizobium sp. CB3481 TaxID=3039158 RepID=UPI0024B13BE5|nr:hypothetical protein [Bradyrhizobium sp. CB3481]WFU14723.1 hypothetical protein QA643_27095 [Bradyrhizobium sp. CB3481]
MKSWKWRRLIKQLYNGHRESFEGIKPPYVARDRTEVTWFLYFVHRATRFTRSSRNAIFDDLRIEQVEAAAYCYLMHLPRQYFHLGYRHGVFLVTEKIAISRWRCRFSAISPPITSSSS